MHTTTTIDIDATSHPDLFARLTLGDDTPERLWVKGNINALTDDARPSVTIAGARAATSYGEHITHEIVSDLATTHRIVTGGAYGIEGAANRAARLVGMPSVIVTAAGVDRAYPLGHADLFQSVIDAGGVIVSENEPGTAPTRGRFMQRQRILAALSSGTVIVEAGYRSGALQVAWWTDQLGRKLGGVPGPCTSSASTGVHAMIRQYRAELITSAQDVRDMLA